AQSKYASHPCYLDMQMESFIGTQIIVKNKPYGTLNFTSHQARRIPFNESDRVYIELMGKWVSKMMELDLQQKRLIEQNEELSSVNEQLDSFVYTVSHDLKLPAINVTNMIQILKGRIQVEDAMGSQALEILEKSGTQLQTTVEDLLAVSRIKHTVVDYDEISLKKILTLTLEGFKNKIEEADISIHINLGQCDKLHFSTPYLKSILQNIISNSIKYRAHNRKSMLYIECYQTELYKVIELTDNGIGMDLSKGTEKLFAMFKRLHDHVEGSGVGMHIVKKIMEKYKGEVEVESIVNQGTMVRLKFFNKAM
ncbi:MAG: ATP-binding protein, partial [Chitinophagales bacterium]